MSWRDVPESVCVASDFGRSESEHGERAVCEGSLLQDDYSFTHQAGKSE